jgi:hypothetical protein
LEEKKEKPIQLKTLEVKSPDQIKDLNHLIHDEWFDIDQIQIDTINKEVTLPYRRKFHEGPRKTIRNWIIYTLKETDVIRSELRIRHANHCIIKDDAKIGRYTFNVAEYDEINSRVLIHCEPNLKIRVDVSELQIKSEDIELTGKARISYLFGIIESDKAIWNEP